MSALEHIPDKPSNQYPERVSVAVSMETKKKIEYLRRDCGKDVSSFLRAAIDKALESVKISS